MQRESMEFDLVIVGAGPAGLAAAIRAKQCNQKVSVVVIDKGSEPGSHIISGAVFQSTALDELLPHWRGLDAPVSCEVKEDRFYHLNNDKKGTRLPSLLVPSSMHNKGNFIISLGKLCQWLGQQAEQLGVEIYSGFAATEVLFDDTGRVNGVLIGDFGSNEQGEQTQHYQPGLELRAKFTLLAEGSRGHLGRELIQNYSLDAGRDPQHYALGIKETWQIDSSLHRPGLVMHGSGWPLKEHQASGGWFLYHGENSQISLGLITDLNYSNPWLSPFNEFQRLKHHPLISSFLAGASRLCYGARSITKGGLHSLPRQDFPGGMLTGCDAGTLNFARIKGSHTAMKSGMLAAEAVCEAIDAGTNQVIDWQRRFEKSWLYDELYRSRNFNAAMHRLGYWLGAGFHFIDQSFFGGRFPVQLHYSTADHDCLLPAEQCQPFNYNKPDNSISFDRLSSLYISNTHHRDDQPNHLRLHDAELPINHNLALYEAPEQRYCPAGVYEIIRDTTDNTMAPRLQINAQNCLHCKTCDIKDPRQNIRWSPPEGGGGPNYSDM